MSRTTFFPSNFFSYTKNKTISFTSWFFPKMLVYFQKPCISSKVLLFLTTQKIQTHCFQPIIYFLGCVKRSRIFFSDHVLCNIYCEKPIFEKEFTTVRLITCGMLPCCCCFEASFLACCLLFEHFFWLLHFYFCKVEPSRRLWHTIIIWRVLFFQSPKVYYV